MSAADPLPTFADGRVKVRSGGKTVIRILGMRGGDAATRRQWAPDVEFLMSLCKCRDGQTVIVWRNTLPANGFKMSLLAVCEPGTEKAVMGEYFPTGRYYAGWGGV